MNTEILKKRITWFAVLTGVLALFVIVGLYGLIANNIIQHHDHGVVEESGWFSIPFIIIGIYYARKSTFGYSEKTAYWKNAIASMMLSVFFSMILLMTFQGYKNIYNSAFGKQKDFVLNGEIIYIDEPSKKGKLFSTYTLEIIEDSTHRRIKLDTRENEYVVGQRIKKEMKIGSLKYIYSNE